MSTITIKAKVIGIRTFQNNWAIMTCEQGPNMFRAAGTILHEANTLKGVVCSLEGEWENHPRYGTTFKLKSLSPDGSEMFFFLTRIVKVGAIAAKSMVEMFTDDELTGIMEDPARHNELLKVKGIGDARLDKITEAWGKYRHVKLLSDFLTPYGLTPNLVMRVYNRFEERSVDIIKKNPYQLTRVPGIGFKKADDVALRLGMQPHDPFRLAACIEYVMSIMGDDAGNTLVKPDDVVTTAYKELITDQATVSLEDISNELEQMVKREVVVRLDELVALTRHYTTELSIQETLTKRLELPPIPLKSPAEAERFITSMQEKMGIVFSEEQSGAIRLLASGHRTIVVCGHAGTGKSTLSKALIQLLLSKFHEDEVCCMALSGIASDRIRKTSGFNASTIHTALGWKGTQFEHGADNQLDYQVVLLDESSMVNASLMRQVIGAVRRDAVLILMGDPGQLPPIGAGDPFRNIVDSGVVPVAKLTKIYRQSEDSVLTLFANEIRQGVVPNSYLEGCGFKDFQFVERSLPGKYFKLPEKEKSALREANSQEILQYIEQKMRDIRPYIQDPITDFQLVSPMRKGPLGTDALNLLAQKVFNPGDHGGRVVQSGCVTFKPGDKVVHTQNKDMQTVRCKNLEEYRNGTWVSETKRVFNGSVGIVIDADPDARQVVVAYPEGFVARYDSLLLSAGILEMAYALTAHKCQGSEYQWVLMPVSSSHTIMLTAQWLYTAITRAKQKVVLVGQKYTFERSCKSLLETKRTTILGKVLVSLA